jgi:hypothetical protein
VWANKTKLMGFVQAAGNLERFARSWGKTDMEGLKPAWQVDRAEGLALAVGRNAVVVASPTELRAIALRDGQDLWKQPLPAAPVPWGLALQRDDRVIVALEDGQVLAVQ